MRATKLLLLGLAPFVAVALFNLPPALALENCELETGTRFVICVELSGKTELVATAVTFLSNKTLETHSKLSVPGLDVIECEKAANSGRLRHGDSRYFSLQSGNRILRQLRQLA